MGAKRIHQTKKCSVCFRGIRSYNKSGLCSHHYKMQYWKNKRHERKNKHLCIICGKKVKSIMKTYKYNLKPAIKTYPIRCANCNKKYNKYYKKFMQKPGIKEIKKGYNEKNKEKRKLYNQRPDVKAHRKAYEKEYFKRPDVKARVKEYQKMPKSKRRKKEYDKMYKKRPDVKEKNNKYYKAYYQRNKQKSESVTI